MALGISSLALSVESGRGYGNIFISFHKKTNTLCYLIYFKHSPFFSNLRRKHKIKQHYLWTHYPFHRSVWRMSGVSPFISLIWSVCIFFSEENLPTSCLAFLEPRAEIRLSSVKFKMDFHLMGIFFLEEIPWSEIVVSKDMHFKIWWIPMWFWKHPKKEVQYGLKEPRKCIL